MCGNGTDYNLIALGLTNIWQVEKQLSKSVHEWEHYLEDVGEEGLADEMNEILKSMRNNSAALDEIIQNLYEASENQHFTHSHDHHSHEHTYDHTHAHIHAHEHDKTANEKMQDKDSGVDITIFSPESEK